MVRPTGTPGGTGQGAGPPAGRDRRTPPAALYQPAETFCRDGGHRRCVPGDRSRGGRGAAGDLFWRMGRPLLGRDRGAVAPFLRGVRRRPPALPPAGRGELCRTAGTGAACAAEDCRRGGKRPGSGAQRRHQGGALPSGRGGFPTDQPPVSVGKRRLGEPGRRSIPIK